MATEVEEMKTVVVELGLYRHYKGTIYWVAGISVHTETKEVLVRYAEPSRDDSMEWVRPIGMFLSDVEHEGKVVPRFQKLDPLASSDVYLPKISDLRGH